MAFPKISILFKSTGTTAVARGNRGVVAMVIRDASITVADQQYTLETAADIPQTLSEYNQTQLAFAFKGGVNPPRAIVVYAGKTADTDYNKALAYLETVNFDYMVVPGIGADDAALVAAAVKSMRDGKGKMVKAVLPNLAGDHEGIINFVTETIKLPLATYAAKDFCSRIAGILAGCPLTTSATFQVLPEIVDVPHMTEAECGVLVDAGKLVLFHDGEKVKIARGVNSLQTTTSDKGDEFKKIKIVDTLDMIHSDMKRTAEDAYIGKVANSYDNKCLLVNAIGGYLGQLEADGLLEPGSAVGVDVDAQRAYLKGIGIDTSKLNNQAIKEANTKDKVFIAVGLTPVDAMEEITITAAIG